jgi:hypothetical protein
MITTRGTPNSHKIIPRIEVSLSDQSPSVRALLAASRLERFRRKNKKRSDRREGDKAERDQARLEMRWLTFMSDFH